LKKIGLKKLSTIDEDARFRRLRDRRFVLG
jgi:hypothetical protein